MHLDIVDLLAGLPQGSLGDRHTPKWEGWGRRGADPWKGIHPLHFRLEVNFFPIGLEMGLSQVHFSMGLLCRVEGQGVYNRKTWVAIPALPLTGPRLEKSFSLSEPQFAPL